MTVAHGTVNDGKVVLQGVALPEGAVVTVLADDDLPAVKLPGDLEAELQSAIDDADAEVGGAGPSSWRALSATAGRDARVCHQGPREARD